MAQIVLVLGQSGTGKSASLRNFDKDEVLVINCAGKVLPFKNKFESVKPAYTNMYRDIVAAMDATKKKVIVVDDAQYIMSFQYMRRIQEKGWEKWNDIQGDFFNVIKHAEELPEDTIVYFLSHIERNDDGYEKIKTMGKMLDEKITIEGMFTIVLKTYVKDGTYNFLTQNSGLDTVKSPIGMFETYAIDNDLKYVDTKIRNYYEIGNFISDEELKEIDEAAKNVDIVKPDSDGKRRRTARSTTPTEAPVTEEAPKRTRATRAAEPVVTKEELIAEAEEKGFGDDMRKAIAKEEAEEVAPARRRRKARTNDVPAIDITAEVETF